MLRNHPRGLLVAFFSNMGERFGFYTMMAILVLYLQAKYGLSEEKAGEIYSSFYFSIYALALAGGLLADYTKRYKTVILFGIIIMFAGYLIMAIPGLSYPFTIAGLAVIVVGNGLFKGNLQAVVGQLYDDPKYSRFRDSAFMIFYMGINVGAFFAPFAATGIRNWLLKINGFSHDASLPAQCHQVLAGTLKDTGAFQALASRVSLTGQPVTDIIAFSHKYLEVFSRGYNYAFAIAAGAMIISMLVYISFNKLLPNKEKSAETAKTVIPNASWSIYAALGVMGAIAALVYFLFSLPLTTGLAIGLFAAFVVWILLNSAKEELAQTSSLVLVFIVVIFFWMSFHQNGLTLTFFARDYTLKTVDRFTFMFFNLENILSVIAFVAGIFLIAGKNKSRNTRLVGGALLLMGGAACYLLLSRSESQNAISPEIFQSFNPLFIVSLTFVVMAVFSWLNKKGIEPSTPRKIGIGMIIAALGFIIIMVASLKLVSPHQLKFIDAARVVKFNPVPDSSRVTPYWLMSSYLVLTIAELCLSPMGLSFVSKVAPPRFQGLMQGGWLLATAVGNKLLFIGSTFWGKVDLWQLWLIFILCCLASATFIFSILKRLEKVGHN